MPATIPSVTGNVSQTPVIPARLDNKNAIGRMMMSPLSREIRCAGRAFPIEVKKTERTMFSAAKGTAMKYSFKPETAISCSSIFPWLLKIPVICPAKKKVAA